MKHLYFFVIVIFIQIANAQEQISQFQGKIYDVKEVDVKPGFSKGMQEFYNFLGKNFKVPEEDGISGKIIITFVVEIDGSISDIKVLQDVGYGSGAEAIRVLKKSDKWNPAEKDGKQVRCLFKFPLNIQSGS